MGKQPIQYLGHETAREQHTETTTERHCVVRAACGGIALWTRCAVETVALCLHTTAGSTVSAYCIKSSLHSSLSTAPAVCGSSNFICGVSISKSCRYRRSHTYTCNTPAITNPLSRTPITQPLSHTHCHVHLSHIHCHTSTVTYTYNTSTVHAHYNTRTTAHTPITLTISHTYS